MGDYIYKSRGSNYLQEEKNRLSTGLQTGNTTYNGAKEYPDGWSNSEGYPDHLCRPVIIDAEGRKRPVIAYTSTDDGYVTKTETIVQHSNAPLPSGYNTSHSAKEELAKDYGEVTNGWSKTGRQSHERPPKVDEFNIKTEATQPSRKSLLGAAQWRQTPSHKVLNDTNVYGGYGNYGGQADTGDNGWNNSSSSPLNQSYVDGPFGRTQKILQPEKEPTMVSRGAWSSSRPVFGSTVEKPDNYNSRPDWRATQPSSYGGIQTKPSSDTSRPDWPATQPSSYGGRPDWPATQPSSYGGRPDWPATEPSSYGGIQTKPSSDTSRPDWPATQPSSYGSIQTKPSSDTGRPDWANPAPIYGTPLTRPTNDIVTAIENLKEVVKPSPAIPAETARRFTVPRPMVPKRGTYSPTTDSGGAGRSYGSIPYGTTMSSSDIERKYGGRRIS